MKIRSGSPLWRRVMRYTGRRLSAWAENHGDVRASANGEARLARALLRHHADNAGGRAFVALDVGANEGSYAKLLVSEAARVGCKLTLVVFEPSPLRAEELRAVFSTNSEVRVVEAAVSSEAGEVILHAGRRGSSHASLMARDGLDFDPADAVRVSAIRLDEFLQREMAGERIDLLKLDVEGAEYAALAGLGARLAPELVATVQFEYGGTTAAAGRSLRGLYGLLESRGYAVGKLFPHAVELRPYRDWMEDYSYANYVAVSCHRTARAVAEIA